MTVPWIKEFSLIPWYESLMFEISHGSFLRQPLFRHLMTSLQRSVIFLQKLCFSCPWLANSLMPSYFSCQWFFDAEFLNLRVNIDRFGLRVCAVARIQSLTVIDVRGGVNVHCTRTWDLSKNLHDWIFGPKDQKFYTLKRRKLQLFLLKKQQRKCINISFFLFIEFLSV